MADSLLLGYLSIRGLAQPVRFLLEYLEIPYQEKRYAKPDEWLEEQAQPHLSNQVLANIPYIKDGDEWVFESQALFVYIAHRANRTDLLGSTAKEQVLVAQARGVLQDVMRPLYGLFVLPEEQYQAQKAEYFKTEVVWLLEKLDKFLDGRKWVAGNNITVMDFAIFEFEELLQAFDPVAFDQLNAIKKHHSEFANLPKIKEYVQSDKYISRPFLPPGRSRFY